jgi:hypothetical protein
METTMLGLEIAPSLRVAVGGGILTIVPPVCWASTTDHPRKIPMIPWMQRRYSGNFSHSLTLLIATTRKR